MIDPLEKAKQCECTIKDCTDPQRKIILTNLQKLWIAIAYERARGLRNWLVEAESIDKLHADLVG
jgi:hypothetical protein